jgi:hypothetical protein
MYCKKYFIIIKTLFKRYSVDLYDKEPLIKEEELSEG